MHQTNSGRGKMSGAEASWELWLLWTLQGGQDRPRSGVRDQGTKPSKPPGFRSRRCRRRTWRSCGGLLDSFAGAIMRQRSPESSRDRVGRRRQRAPIRKAGSGLSRASRRPGLLRDMALGNGRTSRRRTRSSSISAMTVVGEGHQQRRGKTSGIELGRSVERRRPFAERKGRTVERCIATATKPSKPPGCGSRSFSSRLVARTRVAPTSADRPLPRSPNGLADASGLRPDRQGGP